MDHPPLVQLLSALPVAGENLKLSENGLALLSGRATFPWTRVWSEPPLPMRDAFPQGVNWYHWPAPESQLFGQILVFGSGNDGERILFLGRLMFIVVTLLTGLVIFVWARQLAGDKAGTMAAALWTLNTVALAYGHLDTG